jgi:hypothetical protein
MSTPVRLAGFLLGLVAVFLVARGVGAVASPVAQPGPESHDDMVATEGGHGDDHSTEAAESEAAHEPGGLASSEQGYTLRVLDEQPLRFVVDGPDGHVVQVYDLVHERPLHLVAINRDGSGYQHLHPELSDDGVWSIDADLTPGTTRLVADFTPRGGPALILGSDVQRAGDYRPATPPQPSRTATVGPYEVTLTGELVPGESSPVTATITRDGEPVTDLAPYLGAFGHLVALREGDLGYLHVHPDQENGEADAGPDVPFLAEVPSAGRYRLFLDFRHDGVVRTAPFTLEATGHDH